jgi:transposase-like protein
MKLDQADQAANPRATRQRRFWSSEEKRRMIAESFTPGASVSKLAQRYGVNANLLFTWRRREAQAHAKGEEAPLQLVPVTVADTATAAGAAATQSQVGRMEIILVPLFAHYRSTAYPVQAAYPGGLP